MKPRRNKISRRPKSTTARTTARPRRQESLSTGEKLVLAMVARGAPLPGTLMALARIIEEQLRNMFCSILLLDKDEMTLRHGAAPSLPESYNRAIDGLAIGPSVGSCGTAAYRKEAVIVSDIAHDPLWANCRDLALSHGLRACWSMPVLSTNAKVLGTFAIYCHTTRSPTAKEMKLIQFAAHLAGIAIARSLAEEALFATTQAAKTSEGKFRGLLESAPDAIVSTDKEGHIVLVNSQAEKMFGYARDELIGKPVEILLPDRFRDRHVGHRTEFYSNLRTRPMGVWADISGWRKDGSEFPVDIALSPLETEGGLLVTAIVRDATDRKRAEKTLKLRADQQTVVAELGQRALIRTSLSMLMDETVSLTAETLKADYCKVLELLPDGKALLLRAGVGWKEGSVGQATVGTGTDSQAGYTLLSDEPVIVDDLRTETRFSGPPLLHEHGVVSGMSVIIKGKERPFGVLGVHTTKKQIFTKDDIHFLQAVANVLSTAIDRKRAEEQDQWNLDRIRALHEMDLAITSTLDLRTILDILLEKTDRLLPFVTATTVRLLNRETGELEPVACRNLDEEEWKVATAAATASGLGRMLPEKNTPVMVLNVQTDPRSLAPEFLRKYGLVSSLRVPLTAKDDVLGALTFFTKEEHQFTDEEVEFLTTLAGQAAVAIHNAQIYEEMAKLAGDLAKSNRVKDEFLSVMSHELRTPLNVVMGYTGMIKDGILGDINPQQEEALDKVLNRANDQLTMINNVLYATVIETEKVKAEMVEVDLGGFLSNLRTAYHGPINKNLTLNWDYPSDLPVIKTDSAKLKQILQNLINNAIKFTEKGSVTVSCRTREGSEQKAEGSTQSLPTADSLPLTKPLPTADRLLPTGGGRWVEFKVADTGVGIPKEHLPIIFEKFRQVDSSETRLFGGVGMGLYIVNKLTGLLRGKVEVESEPGKGTTFTVRIPSQRQ